jgi:N-acetylglucosamine-6-phosphate deacetylase
MRSIPNVSVFCPGDAIEAAAVTKAIAKYPGTCYLRLGRGGEKPIHKALENYEIGKAIPVKEGRYVAILTTGAIYEEIDKAINAGVTNVTHTYNAQSPLHHRDIGVVGSALLRDELNAELICDTIHVSVPAIKLVMKNKPSDKVTLITDAMRAKHMPDGESELGGQLVIVKNGEARLVDGTLAGSVLKMNDAIKNVVTKAGVPFLSAIDMATINPAKNIGLDNEIGSIKEGKNADITVINKNTYEIILTVRDGNVIYKK